MFTYKTLAFRAIEKADLEALRHLHNDGDTYINLASIHFVDEPEQEQWWLDLHTKTNDWRCVIVAAQDPTQVIGRLRIQHIDFQNRNCEIGLDIMPALRRKGYGRMAYEMLLCFLFNHYNMHVVYLRVAAFNTPAVRLYAQLGFEESGSFPQYFFRYGKYWDYLLMSMTSMHYFERYGALTGP